jgi:hypothetical protein
MPFVSQKNPGGHVSGVVLPAGQKEVFQQALWEVPTQNAPALHLSVRVEDPAVVQRYPGKHEIGAVIPVLGQ